MNSIAASLSLKSVVYVFVIYGFSSIALGEIRPSFHLSVSSWRATHIVVVDEEGVVLESWKGDLRPNDRMPLDSLDLPDATKVYYGFSAQEPEWKELPEDAILKVSNRQRVLFLIHDADEGAVRWRPADLFKEYMDASVVWLEEGEAFAIQQWVNPGPAHIRPLQMSKEALKNEVIATVRTHRRFREAAEIDDRQQRAAALIEFLDSDNRFQHLETLEEIKTCGSAAWPVIKPLLHADEYLFAQSELLHVANAVVGDKIVPELERIIREETKYWRSLSRKQLKGASHTPPMAHHYQRLSSALWLLKKKGYADEEQIVARLRREWNKSPLLRHQGSSTGGKSPILEHADAIVDEKY